MKVLNVEILALPLVSMSWFASARPIDPGMPFDGIPDLIYNPDYGSLTLNTDGNAISQFEILSVNGNFDPSHINSLFGPGIVTNDSSSLNYNGQAVSGFFNLGLDGYLPQYIDPLILFHDLSFNWGPGAIEGHLIIESPFGPAADTGGPYTVVEGHGLTLEPTVLAIPNNDGYYSELFFNGFEWDLSGNDEEYEDSSSGNLNLSPIEVAQYFPAVNGQSTTYTINMAMRFEGEIDGDIVSNNFTVFSTQVTVTPGLIVLPGDTDNDGDVDDTDLGVSISNFTGPVGAVGGKSPAQGDTDNDGDVDDTDLGVAISGFTGPLAVPEPNTLALLALGGVLARRRRR